MKYVNGFMTLSARHAAWLLAGAGLPPLPATARANLSTGEAERLELVQTLALQMETGDAAHLAVCRRLLQHLCGPMSIEPATSRLQ
jgi:hypothetical protein